MKDYVVYVTCVVTRTSFLPLSWLIYMINSSTFQSTVNKNTFVIRHNVTIKNRCVIFPMECYLCEKSKICSLLEHREDFWILKLQALSLQGLKISLNYPQDIIWIYFVSILRLVSTRLFVHFILYQALSRGWVMLNLFDLKYVIINNTYFLTQKNGI